MILLKNDIIKGAHYQALIYYVIKSLDKDLMK